MSRRAIVIGGDLRLRERGSLSAGVINILPDGTEVEIKEQLGEWTQIRYIRKGEDPEMSETTGYVMTVFLKELPKKAGTKDRKKTAAKK